MSMQNQSNQRSNPEDRGIPAKIVFVCGDIHGDFKFLNTLINTHIRQNRALRQMAEKAGKALDIVILQCGDFAFFWPGCDSRNAIRNKLDFASGGRVPIYWCAGNHEDHDALENLFAESSSNIAEVAEGVFFCRFGATLDLLPDLTALFAGGAESSDKNWRLEEMRKGAPKIWWEQETISEAEMARLLNVPKADWVISHTAPLVFRDQMRAGEALYYIDKLRDPSCVMLDRVFDKYHPKRWYFGHFHHYMKGALSGCEWTCLSDSGSHTRWWEKILLYAANPACEALTATPESFEEALTRELGEILGPEKVEQKQSGAVISCTVGELLGHGLFPNLASFIFYDESHSRPKNDEWDKWSFSGDISFEQGATDYAWSMMFKLVDNDGHEHALLCKNLWKELDCAPCEKAHEIVRGFMDPDLYTGE